MCDEETMVCHTLQLDNDGPDAIDHVEVAFASGTGIAVRELVTAPAQVFVCVLRTNFVICETLHDACVELVQHAHLFDLKVLVAEVLAGLNTPFQHGSPDAEIVLLLKIAAEVGIGRSMVTGNRRKMCVRHLVCLANGPFSALLVNKASHCLGISATILRKIGIAPDLAGDVVKRLAMARDPDHTRC